MNDSLDTSENEAMPWVKPPQAALGEDDAPALTKEEMALGSFLAAMHDCHLDGGLMREAMRKVLGIADGGAEPVRDIWHPGLSPQELRGTASKPDPQAQAASRRVVVVSEDRLPPKPHLLVDNIETPAPQAQAGEPINGYLHLKPPFEDENGNDISGEYITLQSHREAMAELNSKWTSESEEVQRLLLKLEETGKAIAKKDAALQACVELMLYMRAVASFERNDEIDAAITKAQEALK